MNDSLFEDFPLFEFDHPDPRLEIKASVDPDNFVALNEQPKLESIEQEITLHELSTQEKEDS